MATRKLTVGAAAIHHVVEKMLHEGNIRGVSKLLPDFTFTQAVKIMDGDLVFEGDSSEGVRLVEKPAD